MRTPKRPKRFSEAEIDAALAASGVALWEWDPRTDDVRWSAEAARILSIPEDRHSTAEAFYQLIHPDDRERVRDAMHAALTSPPELGSMRYRVVTWDNKVRWIEGRGGPVFEPDGRLIGLLGSMRDITAQKTSDLKLRENEANLKIVSELATDYVYSLELGSRLPKISILAGSIERATGYSTQAIDDRGGWLTCVHPEDLDRLRLALKALGEGKGFVLEYRIIDPEGEVRWLKDRAVPRRDERTGALLGMAGGVQNITEIRQLEQQLLHSQRVEAIARLAGSVAHDFGNLLTVMLAASDAWDPGTDPELVEAKADLTFAMARAAELSSSLLAFGRKQVGGSQRVEIDVVVEREAALLRRAAGEAVEVKLLLNASGAVVIADPGQLQLVLLNLTVNARDAMPTGGRVTIRTQVGVAPKLTQSTGRPAVLIEVSDTGHGIPADVLPSIFDAFFTTKAEGSGTGLGLATAHGVISQADGTILVDTSSSGTRFSIWLPLCSEGHATRSAPPPGKSVGGRERVLLVEDDPLVRRANHRALVALGYAVTSVESSEAALALDALDQFSLLISDVRLPGVPGTALAVELSRRYPNLAVLLVSGFAEAGPEDANAEAFCFLRKPFTPGVLADRIRELLDPRDG